MKVIALKDHKCFCCEGTIQKGEICYAFIVNPENPYKDEFDVIYTCLRCSEEPSCKVRIRRRGAAER